MIGPLFAALVPPRVEAFAESVAVEMLSAVARIHPPAESPSVVETRERVASCGCVVRERWRPGGWLGRRVRLCEVALAGKSCAAVRGED
jgi:hypothetical protein